MEASMMATLSGLVPSCHVDAAQLLRRYGQPCERVISVNPDSILYVTPTHRPRTMWIFRPPGGAKLIVRVVPGFAAEPPGDWPPDESTAAVA